MDGFKNIFNIKMQTAPNDELYMNLNLEGYNLLCNLYLL